MKSAKYFLVIAFSLLFSLSPLSYQVFPAHSDDSSDYEELTGYSEWSGDMVISKNIDILEGATLVIKKGTNITFKGKVFLYVDGKLDARGTVKEPIKFRFEQTGDGSFYSSFYSISVYDGGEATFRNVDIKDGGEYQAPGPPPVPIGENGSKFINQAYANSLMMLGAIQFMGGKLEMDHCNFHDNKLAFYSEERDMSGVKVNRSTFQNNIEDVVNLNYSNADFRYNFWGRENGPDMDKIIGDVNSSYWTDQRIKHDPVIVIPGILGSMPSYLLFGKLTLDPVFHVYDNLYQEFKNDGYSEGEDLFAFPYEWRDSNVDNAKLLASKIQEIKEKNHWPKVDLVAHSMGGLLARQYIESDYYQNDVDQLVTLGTPHEGAPADYLTWESGDINVPYSTNILDILAEKMFKQEAKENGYSNLFEYIRKRPIESIRDLLPIYNYLYSTSDNSMRTYPNSYPTNSFLENLNLSDNVSKLNQVEFDNIIGNGKSTVMGIRVGKPSMQSGSTWEHGLPEDYDSLSGNHGLQKGDGDGTVPLYSSQSEIIPADYELSLKSDHLGLPANAKKDVLEILTGIRFENVSSDNSYAKNVMMFFVFSPVDIQVVDKDGHRVGKDFATGKNINEIPGAYYSGFGTDNEFLTIPDPEDGGYKLITRGTGSGNYKVEIAEASDDSQSQIAISKTTSSGQQDEFAINLADQKVTSPSADQSTGSGTDTAGPSSSSAGSDSDSHKDNDKSDKDSNNKKDDGKTANSSSIAPAGKIASSVAKTLGITNSNNEIAGDETQNQNQSEDNNPDTTSSRKNILYDALKLILASAIVLFVAYYRKKIRSVFLKQKPGQSQ